MIPLTLRIGLRYTIPARRNRFISFISLTSMAGVALGVWALITVMSIMNGFHRDLRDRILFVVSHVTISGAQNALAGWRDIDAQVQAFDAVRATAPFVLGQGMLSHRDASGGAAVGALIRGIDPAREREVSKVLDNIVQGDADALTAGRFGIVLGAALATRLGVSVGDKVTLISPSGRVTPAGFLPRLRRFEVVGLFRINMYEYDNGIALIHIDDAARLFGARGKVGGLRLKLNDVDAAPRVHRQLERALLTDAQSISRRQLQIRDWTQEHANFFRALQIEKRVVFIVLMLIIAVAAFNIVSTLVMAVTDKRADIAILRTLGLSPGAIMRVFMIQGALIGIIGTALGGALGVVTALNVQTIIPAIENFFNTELFPIDIYLITDFPAEMRTADVVRVIVAALLMSFVATWYPASKASRLAPADALRYE